MEDVVKRDVRTWSEQGFVNIVDHSGAWCSQSFSHSSKISFPRYERIFRNPFSLLFLSYDLQRTKGVWRINLVLRKPRMSLNRERRRVSECVSSFLHDWQNGSSLTTMKHDVTLLPAARPRDFYDYVVHVDRLIRPRTDHVCRCGSASREKKLPPSNTGYFLYTFPFRKDDTFFLSSLWLKYRH